MIPGGAALPRGAVTPGIDGSVRMVIWGTGLGLAATKLKRRAILSFLKAIIWEISLSLNKSQVIPQLDRIQLRA